MTENLGCVHEALRSGKVSLDTRGDESQMSKSNSIRRRGNERFSHRTDQVERIFEESLYARYIHVHAYSRKHLVNFHRERRREIEGETFLSNE